jgi:hypothetical protein
MLRGISMMVVATLLVALLGGALPTASVARLFSGEPAVVAELPEAALERLRQQDRAIIEASLQNRWVPQLASGFVGVDRDGRHRDAGSVLSEHTRLRGQYGALLASSNDYVSAHADYWLSIVNIGYATSAEALDWCRANGLMGNDACYAKLLTHDGSIEDVVAYQ